MEYDDERLKADLSLRGKKVGTITYKKKDEKYLPHWFILQMYFNEKFRDILAEKADELVGNED